MTNFSTMCDEPMAGHGPKILRDYPHQLKFDFIRIFLLGPSQTVSNSFYMRVHSDGLLSIRIAENDVGRFPAHSGESREVFQGARHPPLRLFYDLPAAGNYILGLVVIKTCWADLLFQNFYFGLSEVSSAEVLLEKTSGDLIHPFISALGG